jgi:hypothetical protein
MQRFITGIFLIVTVVGSGIADARPSPNHDIFERSSFDMMIANPSLVTSFSGASSAWALVVYQHPTAPLEVDNEADAAGPDDAAEAAALAGPAGSALAVAVVDSTGGGGGITLDSTIRAVAGGSELNLASGSASFEGSWTFSAPTQIVVTAYYYYNDVKLPGVTDSSGNRGQTCTVRHRLSVIRISDQSIIAGSSFLNTTPVRFGFEIDPEGGFSDETKQTVQIGAGAVNVTARSLSFVECDHDVDGDGRLSCVDLVRVQELVLAGGQPYDVHADVVRDGIIDSVDAAVFSALVDSRVVSGLSGDADFSCSRTCNDLILFDAAAPAMIGQPEYSLSLDSDLDGDLDSTDRATLLTGIGDLNLSGAVDFGDVTTVLKNWGSCSGCTADFDFDGVVGFADLTHILANFGCDELRSHRDVNLWRLCSCRRSDFDFDKDNRGGAHSEGPASPPDPKRPSHAQGEQRS